MSTVMRLLARASLPFDSLRRAGSRAPGKDRTGLLEHADEVSVTSHGPLFWAGYDSIAHALWRSQEVTLLRPIVKALPRPIADFGCGDGSFARLLDTPHIDLGIDIDPDAVAAATASGMYSRVVLTDGAIIPLPDQSCASILSNSVLEHCPDIDATLAEIARILRPGGRFVATMPSPAFTAHLRWWFGRKAADAVNSESVHINLHDQSSWQGMLARHGLAVRRVVAHQHPGFTWAYRMSRLLGRRALGRFPLVHQGALRLLSKRYRTLLARSLVRCPPRQAANLLIIAERLR